MTGGAHLSPPATRSPHLFLPFFFGCHSSLLLPSLRDRSSSFLPDSFDKTSKRGCLRRTIPNLFVTTSILETVGRSSAIESRPAVSRHRSAFRSISWGAYPPRRNQGERSYQGIITLLHTPNLPLKTQSHFENKPPDLLIEEIVPPSTLGNTRGTFASYRRRLQDERYHSLYPRYVSLNMSLLILVP